MNRASDVRRARRLSVISVVLGGIVAVFAIAMGAASGSLSMVGFGVDAAIDAAASVVLVWRFTIESTHSTHDTRAEHAEHLAERLIGIVLGVAAVALILGAARSLFLHDAVTGGVAQVAVLVVSLVALPPLAVAKRRVADRLGSNALRKDALLTAAAAVLAGVALLGGQLAPALGLWWADAVGSIVIAVVLGRESWTILRTSG